MLMSSQKMLAAREWHGPKLWYGWFANVCCSHWSSTGFVRKLQYQSWFKETTTTFQRKTRRSPINQKKMQTRRKTNSYITPLFWFTEEIFLSQKTSTKHQKVSSLGKNGRRFIIFWCHWPWQLKSPRTAWAETDRRLLEGGDLGGFQRFPPAVIVVPCFWKSMNYIQNLYNHILML